MKNETTVTEKFYGDHRRGPTGIWGKVQNRKTIQRGVHYDDTASHGGFCIALGTAKKLLSPEALEIGHRVGDYVYYEEDCAASIVLYEHPEWIKPLGFHDVKEHLAACLREYYPTYCTVKGITSSP